jgi:hypothetical protein
VMDLRILIMLPEGFDLAGEPPASSTLSA